MTATAHPLASAKSRTVGDTLRSLFPEGTHAPTSKKAPKKTSWDKCPVLPSDVFAGAAFLLDRSGAYSAIRIGSTPSKQTYDRAVLWLKASERKKAVTIGRQWQRHPHTPDELMRWWRQIWDLRGEPIFVGTQSSQAPTWWLPALQLLIAADEASLGVGYPTGGESLPWFANVVAYALNKHSVQEGFSDQFGQVNIPVSGLHTIAERASDDIACILPKSRTAIVGSTLRSLTHNLAMLPAQGVVRTAWYPSVNPVSAAKDKPFNLLLIPFPFSISAQSFEPKPMAGHNAEFGWFKLRQDWLGKSNYAQNEFAQYVESLIKTAEMDVGEVHGIVLPELALNWDFYEVLRQHIKASCKHIELLVAGVSTYPVRNLVETTRRLVKHGNFVVTTCLSRGPSGHSVPAMVEFPRAKHHRWRLEGSQILKYALGASLDPKVSWWEDIDLTWRELDVAVIRHNASITSLICEDLARLDPSQIAVRSVGPTLVIALLMDGPQLVWRWPARNATVLAEDPGSSVISLTSMGLIDRMNRVASMEENRCVGLWRDDRGTQRELHLKKGCDAILLTLSSSKRQEWSLDGRPDNTSAVGWSLSGERYVTAEHRPAWIVPT